MTDKANQEDSLQAEESQPVLDEAPGAEMDPAALQTELQETRDKYLRLAAETENFKRRTEREKAEFLKRANEAFMKDLLPTLDNLERALSHAGGGRDLSEGVEMVYQELKKTLERHGLEPVVSLGAPFDPQLHEAMMQQEDPDSEEGTVINELQKGYLFQGRLLRPAMVVVSKRPESGEDEGGAAEKETGRNKDGRMKITVK